MSKSREVLAGISAATVIAIAGCGDSSKTPKKAEHRPHPTQQKDYTPEIKHLAATLFKLAAEDPDQFTPDNFNAVNIGIRENTKDSGQLTIEAGYGESLTSNTVFGPLSLRVEQTFPDSTGFQTPEPNGGHNGFDIGFTLSIDQDSSGVWSTECVDNAPLVTTVGEVGMKTVYFAGGYSVTNEQAAQGVLTNEIAAVRYALGIASKPVAGDQPKPMVDACLGSFTNQP